MDEAPAAPHQRAVGPWLLEQEIGAGSFAVVWKARHSGTGAAAAVKEINTEKLNKKLQESLASEVAVLDKTKHDNIVGLLDLLKDGNRIYIVLEYCAGGDLGHYIRRYGRVSEPTARYFMQQLAEGLKELRRHNVIHRDLKPQNLLLSDTSAQPLLKIADFGFARSLAPQGLAETLCGSPLYMAPEILQFHKYDAKADLWSIGTILFELLTGKPPFTGANHMQLLRNIERSEAKLPDALAARLSPACVALIKQLLQRKAVERITFEEFFVHPFLAKGAGGSSGSGSGDNSGSSSSSSGVPPSMHVAAMGAAAGAMQWPVQQRPAAAAAAAAAASPAETAPAGPSTPIQHPLQLLQPAALPPQPQPQQPLLRVQQPTHDQPQTRQWQQPLQQQQQQVASAATVELSDSIERDYVVVHKPVATGTPHSSPVSSKGTSSGATYATSASPQTLHSQQQQQQQRVPSVLPASRLSSATGPGIAADVEATVQPGQSMIPAALTAEQVQQQQAEQQRRRLQRQHEQRHVQGSDGLGSNAELLAYVVKAVAECACGLQQGQGMDVLQQQPDQAAECLAAQLLGLRLLECLCQPQQQQQQQQEEVTGAASGQHLLVDASMEDMRVLQEAAVELLASVTQRLEQEQQQQEQQQAWSDQGMADVLPDAADLLYHKALLSSKAGAAEEMVGNWDAASALYAQAADLLLFLGKAWPQLAGAITSLPTSERARMRRLYFAVRGRLAACVAMPSAVVGTM